MTHATSINRNVLSVSLFTRTKSSRRADIVLSVNILQYLSTESAHTRKYFKPEYLQL